MALISQTKMTARKDCCSSFCRVTELLTAVQHGTNQGHLGLTIRANVPKVAFDVENHGSDWSG